VDVIKEKRLPVSIGEAALLYAEHRIELGVLIDRVREAVELLALFEQLEVLS
jgi:hypothetical protein